MIHQKLLVPLIVLSLIKTDIFLSLEKGKKNQQDFFIKNEAEILFAEIDQFF